MNTIQNEEWRDVPGYEGRYQVSDQGRVRSLDCRVRIVIHGVETTRRSPGRMLKPGGSGSLGHVTVAVGKGNSIPVHTLVMLAFVGPRPKGMDVAHNNGTPGDNRLCNLRYATRQHNNQDIVYHGRRRLTVEQIQRIRAEGNSFRGANKTLAAEFGVAPCTISAARLGRNYGYVK